MCSSEKVGGNGNDTLASSGKCNDQLTGGQGADKFICGEGTDTVKDYNSKEGDVILDPQNCEKILWHTLTIMMFFNLNFCPARIFPIYF